MIPCRADAVHSLACAGEVRMQAPQGEVALPVCAAGDQPARAAPAIRCQHSSAAARVRLKVPRAQGDTHLSFLLMKCPSLVAQSHLESP